MSNNLIVSYELINPEHDHKKVVEAVKSLGRRAQVQASLWYVDSLYTSSEAASIMRAAMHPNDTLIVVNTSSNSAHWYNLSDELAEYVRANWRSLER